MEFTHIECLAYSKCFKYNLITISNIKNYGTFINIPILERKKLWFNGVEQK